MTATYNAMATYLEEDAFITKYKIIPNQTKKKT